VRSIRKLLEREVEQALLQSKLLRPL
jgi:hypothetical protein